MRCKLSIKSGKFTRSILDQLNTKPPPGMICPIELENSNSELVNSFGSC